MNEVSADVGVPSQEESTSDWNTLKVDKLDVHGVTISLISCDHDPELMPKDSPWSVIEGEIEKSSLVFVEYFPHELETTVYNVPIIGKAVKAIGESKGINDFFNRVSSLAITHDREVAVADIANNLTFSAYYGFLRGPLGLTIMGISQQSKFGELLGACVLAYEMGVNLQAIMRLGMFDFERKKIETLMIDMEDARRLYTARGIQQEAERRGEGSQLTYIAPGAIVSRVKWYLEHPDDVVSRVKGKVYSLAIGIPKSTRIYKYSENFQTWSKISDVPTRV
jgi:hypothetical protein